MAFKPSFDPKTGRIKALVRLSYCRVLSKSASVEGGKEKYRTNGLLYKATEEGKAQIKTVNTAVRHFVEQQFPGKDVVKFVKALGDRAPLYDGDEYVDENGDIRDHYEGTRYLRLTNDKKIKLRDRRGNDLDDDEAEDLFRSGFWAIAYFHFYAVKDKAKGGNGIFVTLDGLQFFKRDEEFSGGGMSDDEFDDYGDDEDGDDDLGGDDDDLMDDL